MSQTLTTPEMLIGDNNDENGEKTIINNKKCYSCGMIFRTPANLQRHKSRKTPCLIRNLPEADKNNPLRCIFCNKILSKKENLTRHFKTCKIKNGGMGILDEKVRHEQEIRIINEKNEIRYNELQQQMIGFQEQWKQLSTEHKALLNNTTNSNNTNSNNTNSNNNITNNFHFHNFDKPKLDTLIITQDDLLTEHVTRKVLEMIYFNKLMNVDFPFAPAPTNITALWMK